MTTTPAEREHPAPDERRAGPGAAADRPGIDMPDPDRDPCAGSEWQLRELLAPFVAWLATQDLDETDRRRHREAAERYLRWSHTDTGPVGDRRRRYEHHLHRHDPDHLTDARAGLGWWTQHRQLLAHTLPIDH